MRGVRTAGLMAFLLLGLAVVELRAASTYVVRKGDTLTDIARDHGVSVGALVEANALGRSGHVRVGQRLKIPETRRSAVARAPAARAGPGLNASFQARLARIKVQPGRWKHIVIHHSATSEGSAKGMDRYHREQRRMENGLAYHFVIGNGRGMGDGHVSIGNRWATQIKGGHLASEALNEVSIGICLVGDFEKNRPTPRQLETLTALTRYLMNRCGLPKSAVKTHREINTVGTRCPGRNFDDDAFLRTLP